MYFDAQSRFFIDHYDEIREAFNQSEYPKTEAVLSVLKKNEERFYLDMKNQNKKKDLLG